MAQHQGEHQIVYVHHVQPDIIHQQLHLLHAMHAHLEKIQVLMDHQHALHIFQ